MLIETLRRAARALHTIFLTIKESPEEGYYYPHGTDGETTQSLLILTQMISTYAKISNPGQCLCSSPLRKFSGIMGTCSRDQVSMESNFSIEWYRARYLRYYRWGKRRGPYARNTLSSLWTQDYHRPTAYFTESSEQGIFYQKIVFSYNEADIMLCCCTQLMSFEANTMLEGDTWPRVWVGNLGLGVSALVAQWGGKIVVAWMLVNFTLHSSCHLFSLLHTVFPRK